MKLYVGNFDKSVSEDNLRELFEGFGNIVSLSIIKDRATNESRGFGFVEMASANEAQAAIQALNGQPFHNRALIVNQAREREARPSRDGGSPRFGASSAPRYPRSSPGGFSRRSDRSDDSPRSSYRRDH